MNSTMSRLEFSLSQPYIIILLRLLNLTMIARTKGQKSPCYTEKQVTLAYKCGKSGMYPFEKRANHLHRLSWQD
jgi:hypothetical protein